MVEVTREAMRKALYSKVNLTLIERAGTGQSSTYALADAISDALGIPQAEPEALGTVIRVAGERYIATNDTTGSRRWVRVIPVRANCSVEALRWESINSLKVEVA